MSETEPLTPKQESFCVHYTTIGAETFSNGTRSAIAAGYSENSAYSQASALLKNPKIRERIIELHAENMSNNGITVEKVLADLEHDKLMARKAGQYAVAKECSIAQGKYLAMFTERALIEGVGQTRELTEYEQKEAKRLAALMVDSQQVDVIDVDLIPSQETEEIQQADTPSPPSRPRVVKS